MNSNLINTEEAIHKINQQLYSTIDRLHRQADDLSPRYGFLWKTIDKLIKSGGKRFRPYMSLISYRCFTDKDYSDIVACVSAQELLHLALLIHDDIIDRDYIRYNIDNISGQYYKNYSEYTNDLNEIRHYSDSAAILAGDLLISESYQMILQNAPKDSINELLNIYQSSIFYVAGGELLDTESGFIDDVDNSLRVAELKTAHYSFVAPLLIGATLANANKKSKSILKKLGIDLGVAYQLLDDDLGIFGNEKDTGKSNLSDLKEAKKTYMISVLKNISTEKMQSEFNKYFGKNNMSEDEAQILRNILIDSGARQKNLDKIESLKDSIKSSIEMLDIHKEKQDMLINLVKLTLERNR